MHHYSIVKAKNSLSQIVHEAEQGETIHLTRRGKFVAVLLSAKVYQNLNKKRSSPADALQQFLENNNYKNIDIDPTVFEGLRVKNSGRDIQL